MKYLALLVTLFFLGAVVPAQSHPMHHPQQEMFFAKRCGVNGIEEVLNCVHRGAIHWGQSYSYMKSLSWCESRWDYSVTNPSSGAGGLFQFMPRTWAHTPYASHSRYNPKWASLAAAWGLGHGVTWSC